MKYPVKRCAVLFLLLLTVLILPQQLFAEYGAEDIVSNNQQKQEATQQNEKHYPLAQHELKHLTGDALDIDYKSVLKHSQFNGDMKKMKAFFNSFGLDIPYDNDPGHVESLKGFKEADPFGYAATAALRKINITDEERASLGPWTGMVDDPLMLDPNKIPAMAAERIADVHGEKNNMGFIIAGCGLFLLFIIVIIRKRPDTDIEVSEMGKPKDNTSIELIEVTDDGSSSAMLALGIQYLAKKDILSASKYFDKAMKIAMERAGKDDLQQINILGGIYKHGFGVTQDLLKAMYYYRRAAELGDVDAMRQVVCLYIDHPGLFKEDFAEVLGWFEQAAESGDSEVVYQVALLYSEGICTVKDYNKAMGWYEKAAAQGNAQAMFDIGCMYSDGEGVKQDNTKGIEWFKKAAELGHADSMYNIGCIYNDGTGVLQDHSEAFIWFKQAAELGHPDSIYNIGVMYLFGKGVTKNILTAIIWLERAAGLGYTKAQKLLKEINK